MSAKEKAVLKCSHQILSLAISLKAGMDLIDPVMNVKLLL